MLSFILLIVGLVLLVLAGLSVSSGRLQLGWLGLACIFLIQLLERGAP